MQNKEATEACPNGFLYKQPIDYPQNKTWDTAPIHVQPKSKCVPAVSDVVKGVDCTRLLRHGGDSDEEFRLPLEWESDCLQIKLMIQ